MNKCVRCGKNCEKEYCFKCKIPKKLKSSKLYPKATIENEIMEKMLKNFEDIKKMQKFFISIWEERPHRSEVSGDKLFGEPNSTYFHHILEKSKYPQAMYDEDNIIILSSIEHEQVHLDIYRYEEINKRREVLKEKYGV